MLSRSPLELTISGEDVLEGQGYCQKMHAVLQACARVGGHDGRGDRGCDRALGQEGPHFLHQSIHSFLHMCLGLLVGLCCHFQRIF